MLRNNENTLPSKCNGHLKHKHPTSLSFESDGPIAYCSKFVSIISFTVIRRIVLESNFQGLFILAEMNNKCIRKRVFRTCSNTFENSRLLGLQKHQVRDGLTPRLQLIYLSTVSG